MTRRVTLFNSVQTSAIVNLSDNVTNYEIIEVFYYDNDNAYGSVRFGSGSAYFKMQSDYYLTTNGVWYSKYTMYRVNGKQLIFNNAYQHLSSGDTQSGQFNAFHTIYRVEGIITGV